MTNQTVYSDNHKRTSAKLDTRVSLSVHPESMLTEREALDVLGTDGAQVYLAGRIGLKAVTETLINLHDARQVARASGKPGEKEIDSRDAHEVARIPDSVIPLFVKSCEAAFDKTAVQIQGSIDACEQVIARLEKQIANDLSDAESKTIAGSALATEIRNHYKQLPTPAARWNALEKAVYAGDKRTVAAVLGAPAFLSGLPEDQYKALRAMASRHMSAAATQLDASQRVLARLHAASEHFVREFLKLKPKTRLVKAAPDLQGALDRLVGA